MAKFSEWELWAVVTKFDADFGDEAAIPNPVPQYLKPRL